MKEQIPVNELIGGSKMTTIKDGHHVMDKSIKQYYYEDSVDGKSRTIHIHHHDGTKTRIQAPREKTPKLGVLPNLGVEAPREKTSKLGGISKRIKDIKENFWSNLFTNLIHLMCIIGFSMITNVLLSYILYNDYSDSSWPEPPDEDNPEGFIAYVKRKYWFNSAFLNTISLIITTLYVKFFLWLLTRNNEDKRLSQKLQFGLGMIYTLVLIGYVYYKHR